MLKRLIMKEVRYTLRKCMRKSKSHLAVIAVIFLVWLGMWWISENGVATTDNLGELYVVEFVKDGDTIVCNINGKAETVRLIGVDTPESVHSDASKNCEEGLIASNYTKEMLTGKKVYLEYDEDMYDDYGRLLAYVYLEDKTMYNSLLLEKGYAKTMIIAPNNKYATKFNFIQTKASIGNVGFWEDYFD